MAKIDYYELLGVERGVDAGTLKSAYRKLAMQYHPDRNPGDREAETKFKEVSEAYEVLSDDEKRRLYDQFGHAAFDGAAGGPGGGGFGFSNSTFADVFEDLFGEFMGGNGRGGRGGGGRGADLRYDLQIDLEDAFHGRETEIDVPSSQACQSCDGTGAEAGSKPQTCTTCQGYGKVRTQQGFFTIERTCPRCHGAGQMIENPCRACNGGGRVQQQKTLQVNIPPGVEDGTRIRLSGEGEAGLRGGPPGDLYIFISIAQHQLFRREGTNVYCRVPISMVTAALGGDIEVPTVGGGRVAIQVPAGTQTGKQFRLRGKGMPALQRAGVGDMYIQTMVETPSNLNKRQKELLREFESAGGGRETSPESAGFFGKVKEFWDDLTD
ncbi:MAG: molecular chaperone DnaJ [Alphaproteobacteria bacterium]